MQRRFLVCRLFPPRKSCGADSSTSTRAPAVPAVRAAQSPALPPPITSTSTSRTIAQTLDTKSALQKQIVVQAFRPARRGGPEDTLRSALHFATRSNGLGAHHVRLHASHGSVYGLAGR